MNQTLNRILDGLGFGVENGLFVAFHLFKMGYLYRIGPRKSIFLGQLELFHVNHPQAEDLWASDFTEECLHAGLTSSPYPYG